MARRSTARERPRALGAAATRSGAFASMAWTAPRRHRRDAIAQRLRPRPATLLGRRTGVAQEGHEHGASAASARSPRA